MIHTAPTNIVGSRNNIFNEVSHNSNHIRQTIFNHNIVSCVPNIYDIPAIVNSCQINAKYQEKY